MVFIDIPLICAIIAIIACLYANYTDSKFGIISNKLTFPLIAIGIILNAIYAFMIDNVFFILYCLIYTAIIYTLSYIFWRLRAWAGGDAKLFTGLAALLPFAPGIISYNLFGVQFPIVATYGFPFTLIINSLLSTLPFLLFYVFFIAVRRKPELLDELAEPIKEYRKNIVLTLVISSAVTLTVFITSYFNVGSYLQYQMIIVSLILIYLLTMVISKLPNRIKAIILSVIIVFALYSNINLTIISIVVLFISITIIGIIMKVLTSVNKKAFQDDYKIDELKEGMISAYNIYEQDNGILIDDKGFFSKIKDSTKSGNISTLQPKGKLLISSMAAGISNEDIELLKRLTKENKISDEIKISKGFHFAPSILIGLIVSLFIGDLVLLLQKILYVILR